MSVGAAGDKRAGVGRKLGRGLAIGLVVSVLVLLVYGLATKGGSDRVDQSLADGEAPLAPTFDLPILERGSLVPPLERRLEPALAGGNLGLDELDGTPFVLNFWASWCDPCREEAPILEAGWQRHQRRALFLGLDMQDLTGDARDFLREFGITYPTIREPGGETADAYGATGIPETYFVSARGRVVAHVIGVLSEEQLNAGVAAARTERVVGTLTGGAIRPQR